MDGSLATMWVFCGFLNGLTQRILLDFFGYVPGCPNTALPLFNCRFIFKNSYSETFPEACMQSRKFVLIMEVLDINISREINSEKQSCVLF